MGGWWLVTVVQVCLILEYSIRKLILLHLNHIHQPTFGSELGWGKGVYLWAPQNPNRFVDSVDITHGVTTLSLPQQDRQNAVSNEWPLVLWGEAQPSMDLQDRSLLLQCLPISVVQISTPWMVSSYTWDITEQTWEEMLTIYSLHSVKSQLSQPAAPHQSQRTHPSTGADASDTWLDAHL